MEQLSEGGGAQTITLDTVGEEVEDLAKNYPICIPAYFGLIIRCFGTLEVLYYRAPPPPAPKILPSCTRKLV